MLSFEWDEANVEHIALHQVTPAKAEDVLRSPALELEPEMVDGEERLAEIGQTRAGVSKKGGGNGPRGESLGRYGVRGGADFEAGLFEVPE